MKALQLQPGSGVFDQPDKGQVWESEIYGVYHDSIGYCGFLNRLKRGIVCLWVSHAGLETVTNIEYLAAPFGVSSSPLIHGVCLN
jgi:hypothetical protein